MWASPRCSIWQRWVPRRLAGAAVAQTNTPVENVHYFHSQAPPPSRLHAVDQFRACWAAGCQWDGSIWARAPSASRCGSPPPLPTPPRGAAADAVSGCLATVTRDGLAALQARPPQSWECQDLFRPATADPPPSQVIGKVRGRGPKGEHPRARTTLAARRRARLGARASSRCVRLGVCTQTAKEPPPAG